MAEPMPLFLVSQHFPPDDTSTAAYMAAIANEIAQDEDVAVLSGSRDSAELGRPGKPRVIELTGWKVSKGALLRRSLAMAWFATTVFAALLWRANRRTPVLVVTTPFAAPFAVTLAAKFKRFPTALIAYDLYPDALVAAQLIAKNSLPTRLIRRFNSWMYRSLDRIVIIGRDMQGHFAQYDVEANKLVYIPNWATIEPWARQISSASKFRQDLGARFVVGLLGNLGFTHDPETVYESARQLHADADIAFLLSGRGVGWERLKKMHDTHRLPNVKLVDRVPDSELEAFLAAADCWLIPYKKGMAAVSVPSRMYNILAVGRPIIVLSETDTEHALTLTQNSVGWVVAPANPQALAQTIRLASREIEYRKKSEACVAIVNAQFTIGHAGPAYRQLVKELRSLAAGDRRG